MLALYFSLKKSAFSGLLGSVLGGTGLQKMWEKSCRCWGIPLLTSELDLRPEKDKMKYSCHHIFTYLSYILCCCATKSQQPLHTVFVQHMLNVCSQGSCLGGSIQISPTALLCPSVASCCCKPWGAASWHHCRTNFCWKHSSHCFRDPHCLFSTPLIL